MGKENRDQLLALNTELEELYFASLLNGQLDCFCPQVNLSSALTKIMHSLPATEGRRTIVYTEQDFPSIAFVLQQAVSARLKEAGVLFDVRSTGIRLSPHIYNDAEEIALVLNCLS